MQTMFPVEYEDLQKTFVLGEIELARGEIGSADGYYALVPVKADILEKLYLAELKKREEAQRLLLEQKQQAERELEAQRIALEKAKAAEQARLLELQKQAEAERAEAKRKAERAKQEKEIQLVSRHTVKRGETLPQIAAQQEVYGDASLWPLIYKANRDQISNPAVLWPGQVLKIPRNVDRGDLLDARKFSSEKALR
ncbi:MAG: LysM peptidoglycan-binding domain-containing protein [Geobacter sp.]|nr:LysM peptidoglycan-binding domain-containing protein [Geobacter sp.]